MYIDPSIINNKWTEEEDERLKKLVEQQGKHWALFKQFFPGRSDNNIKNRYNYHIVPIRGTKKICKVHQEDIQQNQMPIESKIEESIDQVDDFISPIEESLVWTFE